MKKKEFHMKRKSVFQRIVLTLTILVIRETGNEIALFMLFYDMEIL